jgi:hypothetical protein
MVLLGILSLIAVIIDAIAMHVYCQDNYGHSDNWYNSEYWECRRMRRWRNTCVRVFMVFNVTFNNISVISRRSVLLVEETGVTGEKGRPAVSH